MKKLPSVYPVPVTKKITNNNEMYYGKNELMKSPNNEQLTLESKINRIFNAPDFVYKKTVKIITLNGTIEKNIVGRKPGYLLTDNNESLRISDIVDIQ